MDGEGEGEVGQRRADEAGSDLATTSNWPGLFRSYGPCWPLASLFSNGIAGLFDHST
jgi:hypothetical protein